MAAPKRKPDAGGVRLPNALSCCSAEKHSENTPEDLALQAKIPSRAPLARRWPKLRVNRLSRRWIDDATGARGETIESLRAFLNEGGNAR